VAHLEDGLFGDLFETEVVQHISLLTHFHVRSLVIRPTTRLGSLFICSVEQRKPYAVYSNGEKFKKTKKGFEGPDMRLTLPDRLPMTDFTPRLISENDKSDE
jgi:hypothetical protein